MQTTVCLDSIVVSLLELAWEFGKLYVLIIDVGMVYGSDLVKSYLKK
jgi:hypothetical protein